jgi:bacterial/archaeal transporter family-2 protein
VDKVGFAAAATVAAGGLIAVQPPIVARVADSVGALPAAAINFLVGAFLLVVLALAFSGGTDWVGDVGAVPWYYLLAGGVVGAAYVTTVVLTVDTLGAAGVVAATIAGQLTASVGLDRIGAFGLEDAPISLERGLGVVLLLVGTYLIVR